MQKRTDRCGSDHGGWQPTMQRHDGVLGETKQEEGKYNGEKHRMGCHLRRRKDSAVGEVEGPAHVVSQDDGGQEQHLGSTEKINDVLASASLCLVRLLVRHE